jgi:hypothetical protein
MDYARTDAITAYLFACGDDACSRSVWTPAVRAAENLSSGMASAINLLTGEYVVGGASPQALYMYRDTFGTKAEPNMWLEPIHWPNTRPRDEEIAEMVEWFKQRRRSQCKRR